MKNCSNCQAKNTDENKFCEKCGFPFPQETPKETSTIRSTTHGEDYHKIYPASNQRIPSQTNPYYGRPLSKARKQPYQPTRGEYRPKRIPRQPQRRVSNGKESNFWPMFFTILSLVVIVGAILIWIYQDSIFGTKVQETEENTEIVEIQEAATPEEATESNNSTPVISANDIVYLSGKIDGKYPVHMTLDLKQRFGVYYYDKYGSSNSMGIEVSQLRAMGNGQWAIIISMATSNGDKNEKWYGTLTDYNFTGNGVFLGKEMPFDLKVDSVLTDSKDPLIQKYMVPETNWKDCVFYGEVSGGGKIFKVEITAQTNLKGEFKDASYHNLSYNVSFPVDVRVNGKHLYISGKSGHNDFRIEATSQEEGYEGHMYADGKSLPITLSDYDIVLEGA
ncbi:MAG: zinc ribbon domain-containing protein [Muribaculaceae bacterium]|nr:zinc ribbon domain-containing protein [Muribaculaceae bacterium]